VPAALLTLQACATYNPGSVDDIPLRERAQTIERDGLTVSVTVLNSDEARDLFDAKLDKRGVQSVWIEVENQTDANYYLMLTGLDPNYFSANEVAYMNHKSFSKKANTEMDKYFSSLAIYQQIRPGETQSGFAFSNEKMGTKEVRVRLYSVTGVQDFEFFVTVPGLVSEWDAKDLDGLYTDDEMIIVDDEKTLRQTLLALQCCMEREGGGGEGAPVNVIMIGGIESLKALIKAGWDETIFLPDLRTTFGSEFLYGRPPDIQFEKVRRRIGSTISMRLWLTQIVYRGQPVIVGSIRRSIDPDVDEAAAYLFEEIATTRMLAKAGLVGGIPPVPKSQPKRIYAGEYYWTMGNRIVLELSDTYTPLDQIQLFNWDWPNRRIYKPGEGPQAGEQQ